MGTSSLATSNMATAGSVLYRKQSKSNLYSGTHEGNVLSQVGVELRKHTEAENTLLIRGEENPERVLEVNFHASKRTKIENFEKFTKLRCLDLSCNQIKTITGLDKNTELKELKVYSNKIKSVEGLDKLRELCSLQLQDNLISKIGAGLQHLKMLKTLRVDCNEISSISVSEMATCSKLTSLNVSSNKLSDISFINCLPNLEEFYASHNNINKIPDIGRCTKLQELDLSHNSITSAVGIESLTSLTTIRLEHNGIKEFSNSGTVTTLEQLYISCNKVISLKKLLLKFPFIEALDVSSNRLENLDELCKDLSQCTMLRELNISDNPCYNPTSLDHQNCLKALPRLEVLNNTLVKRPQSSCGKNRPLMRPVSASQMISTRHLEDQISCTMVQQNSFKSMISSKFDLVYDLLKKLPEESVMKSSEGCRKLKTHFLYAGSSTSSQPITKDSQRRLDSPRSCGDGSRPSSHCSNRARIQDAKIFSAKHFVE